MPIKPRYDSLDGAIRELGEYEIMIQLHADVVTTANIAVVAE